MAIKFGKIKSSDVSFEEQTFHKNIRITSASIGVNQHFGLRDDYSDKDDPTIGLITTSGSQWAFIHTMFYTSGSEKYAEQNIDEVEKFNNIYDKYNEYNDLKPFHNNKFYDTASVFYIPQQYFGERIKPGTFEFTARTGSNTNTTNEIIIKDDNNGNLYSSNAHHSQSSNTPLSSSENYVGNIYYDLGIAVLTETSGLVVKFIDEFKSPAGIFIEY